MIKENKCEDKCDTCRHGFHGDLHPCSECCNNSNLQDMYECED